MTPPDVKLVAFDFDGVLTDNTVYIADDGTETVRCNRADGLAFDAFRRLNIPTVIVSTERNPVVSKRAEKLKIPCIQAVTNKVDALSELCLSQSISMSDVMFVGNDLNDLSVMEAVGYSVAVADAHPRILAIAWKTLFTTGGGGAAREVAEHILGIDVLEYFGKT